MHLMTKILPLFFICLNLVKPQLATAASQALGVAQRLEVAGDNLGGGLIVSSRESEYFLSQETYDKNMFGVIADKPAIEISLPSDTLQTVSVLTKGTVPVKVSGESGEIKKGDRITSSSQPGIGMKATKTGFILGTAQESFSGKTKNETGTISVFLNIKFTFGEDSPASEIISKRMLDMVSLSAVAVLEEPKEIFRHTLGAFIIIASIIFTFLTFGQTIREGVKGIARNPLAKQSIIFGIVVNVGLSILIIGAGLGAAYFVISLP